MVYRGRPSSGCMKCRRRKIKCDERPDGCVKCEERGFECPGYDANQIDRYFQDETAHVRDKVERAKAKAIARRDEQTVAVRATPAPQFISVDLAYPSLDLAIAFFMQRYAIGLDQPATEAHMYNQHISTLGFHPLVANAMTAMGLAGISNLYFDTNLNREATRWYSKALKSLNEALASPTECTADNTLASILMLSLFEATNNKRTLASWSSHVNGAASLIRLRGAKQFSTSASLRLYYQSVSLLAMNCMGSGEALPDFVHDLNKKAAKHENAWNPGNKFFHLHIASIDLRSEIIQGRLRSLEQILEKAMKLDAVGKAVFEGCGADWSFEVVQTEEDIPGVFGDHYHVYPTCATANTWNWVRYTRMYFNDIIRNTLLTGFSATPPAFVGLKYMRLLEDSTKTLYELQSDILASMPQQLHDTPSIIPDPVESSYSSRDSANVSVPANTGTPSPPQERFVWSNFRTTHVNPGDFLSVQQPKDKLPVVRLSGGYSLVWSLFIAGASPIASPKSQQFVLKCLERLTVEFGINQAKVLAIALRMNIRQHEAGKVPFTIVPSYLPRLPNQERPG
ncbi:hypothetical protein EJ04DRAFT_555058 [Polyplosphaeria fusca]|uniref:Zn(2)-C6 fungal-type domain-containing protein n=1 Tax=Polyplosphaeria fusca TaxID=682080 RepID=A0A9P4QNV2_9PLEO|nr:hypothetical protein EJ04DRAFT_555058 [Polyplosphaeria fusca]